MYDFEHELKRCHIRDMAPVYVLDTSAIIDLCRSDREGLLRLLSGLNGNGVVTDFVLAEAKLHADVTIGHRKEICKEVMSQLERISAHNAKTTARIMSHPGYDDYRFEAYCVCNNALSGKKVDWDQDPISITDRHLLATAITLAVHPEEFHGRKHYPLILASDSHIVDTMVALQDHEARHYADESNREFGRLLAYKLRHARVLSPRWD